MNILLSAIAALFGLAPVLSSWDNPPTDAVTGVEHRTFRSESMKVDVGYNIYLPPGYAAAAADNRRYPVLYWLHGLGGNETSGMFPTSIIDGAIKDKSIPPLIVVFVNGGARTRYHDSIDGKIMADTLVSKELIEHIDKTYRTIASRDGRAISGMSMGGNGSLKFAFKYPELFSSAVAFAPALVDGQWMEANDREFLRTMFGGDKDKYQEQIAAEEIKRNADKVRGNVAILILIGKDDSQLERNRAMHKLLEGLKVPHEYEEQEGVGHDLDRLLAKSPARGLIFAANHFKESQPKCAAVRHPNLLLNQEEIEQVKAKIAKYPWAAAGLERTREQALKESSYLNAALYYAFTGDKTFADRARGYLLGHVNDQTFGAWGISWGAVAWTYDLVYDTCSEAERVQIERWLKAACTALIDEDRPGC